MRKKSADYHKLTGTFEPFRHAKTGLSYPPSDGRPPRWMKDVEAKREWRRIVPLLLGNLQQPDETLLGSYCMAVSGYLECLKLIQEQGWVVTVSAATRTGQSEKPIKNPAVTLMDQHQKTMQSVAARFGFSPYDRSRISGTSAPDDGEPTTARATKRKTYRYQLSDGSTSNGDASGPWIQLPGISWKEIK
jgi:P27 family predicted phage terminase small subunit